MSVIGFLHSVDRAAGLGAFGIKIAINYLMHTCQHHH